MTLHLYKNDQMISTIEISNSVELFNIIITLLKEYSKIEVYFEWDYLFTCTQDNFTVSSYTYVDPNSYYAYPTDYIYPTDGSSFPNDNFVPNGHIEEFWIG